MNDNSGVVYVTNLRIQEFHVLTYSSFIGICNPDAMNIGICNAN